MSRRYPRPRAILLSTVMAALLGVVVYAVQREVGSRSGLGDGARHGPPPVSDDAHRALSAEEEAYAAALWPLHSEVKLAAVRMTFAGIAYKTEDHDPEQLAAKVRPLGGTLETVAAKVRSLEPPPSLRPVHDRYVGALGLYGPPRPRWCRVLPRAGTISCSRPRTRASVPRRICSGSVMSCGRASTGRTDGFR